MQKKNRFKYIPAVMLLVLPFLMKKTAYRNRFRVFAWSSDSYWMTDDFLICKAAALLLFTLAAVIACLVQWRRDNCGKGRRKIYREWAVYLILAVLSAVNTEYPDLSFWGANDQFEPVWILCAYILCAFLTSFLMRTGREREMLYRAAACMASVMGVIGMVQFLILKERVYLTLYNPNYAGMMMALVLPVLYMQLRGQDAGKWKVLYGLGSLGAAVCLVLSGSKGAAAVSVWLFVLFLIQQYGRRLWERIFAAVSFAAGFGFLLWLCVSNPAGEAFIKNVVTDSEGVSFETENGTLKIQFFMVDDDHYSFVLTDEAGKNIPYEENAEGTRYCPEDDRFTDILFTIADYDGRYGFLAEADGREWYFARMDTGEYGYMNGYFHLDQFCSAPHVLFKGREGFATNRGYIWSRTLPVLARTVLLGTGPDTFAAVFPQNDVGKYLVTDMPYKMIVTRPHNFFLQTAVQTGMLSLGAMLFGFWRVLRTLYRRREDREARAAVFALCAYLLCGMFYDSSLCTAPVFWVLFGAGISICREHEQDAQKQFEN